MMRYTNPRLLYFTPKADVKQNCVVRHITCKLWCPSLKLRINPEVCATWNDFSWWC